MDSSSNVPLGASMSAISAGSGVIVRLQHPIAPPGFTARDRSELARWADSGGRTVLFDDEDGTSVAMLYDGTMAWSSWAMARQHGALLVWNCITFADVGRFGCMLDALAALCGTATTSITETNSNVIAFATAHLTGHHPVRAL